MIYLDHAATSWPKPAAVVEAVQRWYTEIGVSADRGDSALCQQVSDVVDETRRALARSCGSIDGLMELDSEELEKIPDVGPEVAAAVREYFRDAGNAATVRSLLEAGVEAEAEAPPAGAGPLEGETFVFTGQLSRISRSKASALARSLGASVVGSV